MTDGSIVVVVDLNVVVGVVNVAISVVVVVVNPKQVAILVLKSQALII